MTGVLGGDRSAAVVASRGIYDGGSEPETGE